MVSPESLHLGCKSPTVDGRNPANHLGCIKPCKYRDKLPINWLAGFLPSTVSGLQRPKFKIQVVCAHGILMKLWVLDPPADASTVIETLSRIVDGVIKTCEERNHRVPKQLMVWVAWLHSSLSIFVMI